MTQEQIDRLKRDIEAGAKLAAPLVALLGSQAVAALVIGQAVAKEIPELVSTIQNWIAGKEPTPEEKATFEAKLADLGNPNLP